MLPVHETEVTPRRWCHTDYATAPAFLSRSFTVLLIASRASSRTRSGSTLDISATRHSIASIIAGVSPGPLCLTFCSTIASPLHIRIRQGWSRMDHSPIRLAEQRTKLIFSAYIRIVMGKWVQPPASFWPFLSARPGTLSCFSPLGYTRLRRRQSWQGYSLLPKLPRKEC